MIQAAITFFVLALIALLLGATGFAGVTMEIGKTLLVIFLLLALFSYLISLGGGKAPPKV